MSPLRTRHRRRALGRRLRPLLSPRRALAVAFLGCGLVAIEWYGRGLESDPGDLLMLVALGLLLLLAATISNLDAALLGKRLERRRVHLARRISEAWPRIGVDFRDDPTTPHGVPRVVVRSTAILLLAATLGVAWNLWAETSLRALLAPRLYLLYLLILTVQWVGLVLATALGVLIAAMTARHVRWIRGEPSDGVRKLVLTWLAALLIAGLFLPVEVALLLGFGAVFVTLWMTHLVRVPRLTLLWRTASDGRLGASSWATTLWQGSALPMAGFLLFVALTLSGTWTWAAPGPAGTPLTDGLARIAAWCLGPGFLVLAVAVTLDLKRLVGADPSVPCPTTLHVTRETTADETARIERLFRARGWEVHYAPQAPGPTDVRLRLVDSPMPRPPRGWPLAVSARALEVPELLDLIARRDVVQRRRVLRRGLERLFKDLQRREYERGEGFWIAPHLWFVSATTRDTEEEDLSEDGINNEIGTPYARLFPLPVRHHLLVVLREVEVDIILLEDGVRWSAFRRVLDRVFAHCDEGRGRIEERDFHGILGVRVILHELEPGGQLEVEGYPEPDYTDLARARILHVFKDRGGEEDELEPVPSEDTGVLVGV